MNLRPSQAHRNVSAHGWDSCRAPTSPGSLPHRHTHTHPSSEGLTPETRQRAPQEENRLLSNYPKIVTLYRVHSGLSRGHSRPVALGCSRKCSRDHVVLGMSSGPLLGNPSALLSLFSLYNLGRGVPHLAVFRGICSTLRNYSWPSLEDHVEDSNPDQPQGKCPTHWTIALPPFFLLLLSVCEGCGVGVRGWLGLGPPQRCWDRSKLFAWGPFPISALDPGSAQSMPSLLYFQPGVFILSWG